MRYRANIAYTPHDNNLDRIGRVQIIETDSTHPYDIVYKAHLGDREETPELRALIRERLESSDIHDQLEYEQDGSEITVALFGDDGDWEYEITRE